MMFNRLLLPSYRRAATPHHYLPCRAARPSEQNLFGYKIYPSSRSLLPPPPAHIFKFTPASDNLPRSELRSPDLPCPSGARPSPDYHRWWWILNKTLHWEKSAEQMVAYLFLAAAARSLCLLFLNQLPTCVGVSPVAWASSLFLLGLG